MDGFPQLCGAWPSIVSAYWGVSELSWASRRAPFIIRTPVAGSRDSLPNLRKQMS